MQNKKSKRGEKNFEGMVKVYNDEIFISTKTGVGVDFVLKKMDPLLSKMASRTYLPGYRFEDIKQELSIIAIEGIKNYDNSKGVKLSTFLHVHLRNKIISKVLSKNRLSADAVFSDHVETEESSLKTNKVREEILFSSIRYNKLEDSDNVRFDDKIDSSNSLYKSGDNSDFDAVFNSALKTLDEETQNILKKAYLEEKNIVEIAQDFNLQPWMVSKKLKSKQVKELFGMFQK